MSKDSREQRRAQARAQREAAERAAAQADLRRRRLAILGGVAIVAVIAVVLVTGSGGGSSAATVKAGESVPNQQAIATQLAGIPQQGITLGRPDAPITVVEYGDLQCPICANFSRTVLPGVIDDYVRTGRARIEFRNLTFIGPDSERMARFAAAAGAQNRLWNVIELIYADQGEENTGYADDDFLRTIGSGVSGLDVAQALDGRDGSSVTAQLDEASQMAQSAGVTGTPTLFVRRGDGAATQVDAGDLPAALKRLTAEA